MIVDTESMPRPVSAVAFDQFVFDGRGLATEAGSCLVRGTSPDGTAIAVGSTPWPGMPIEWVAIQSRRSADLLGLGDDALPPVGHHRFDGRFAIDADDVSRFRKRFRTSLREWLVDFDDAHGPLIVIFDGGSEAAAATTPGRRASDPPPGEDPPGSAEQAATDVATVFLARVVVDVDQIIPTLGLVDELTERVRQSVHR